MTDFAAIIEANDLQFTTMRAEVNPFIDQVVEDDIHWFCTFSGGAISGFDFYVTTGADHGDEPPTAVFALELVAEDVRAYRDCDGYADFARLLGVDDDDPQGFAAFDEISRLSPLIEEVLDLDVGHRPSF
jgi:hypothetical protein